MQWYKFPFLFDEIAKAVLLNDDNLKPSWIAHPAAFSEFHVQRNRDTLLLVIGESWTYGETLPGIATGIQHYDIYKQLEFCFGPRLALTMDCDYYQYAVPGNCNLYMFEELKRILRHVSTLGYRKIYICQQMTEQGRDNPVFVKYPDHPLVDVYADNSSFEDFLRKYDEVFFKIYDDLLNEFSNIDIDAILWRNFCRVNTGADNYKFKIIKKTWIEYAARMVGVDLSSPSFYVAGWISHLQEHYSKKINFNLSLINDELDKIEASNNFIRSNPLHNTHPNAFGHALWAQYLGRQAGWITDV